MRSNNPCNPKRRTFLKNRCKDGATLLLSCYETDKICRFQISDSRFQIVSRRLRGWTQIMARGRRAMPYAECHKAVGLERFLSLFPFSLSPFCLFPFAFSLLPFPFCLFPFAFSKHTFSPSCAEVLLPTVMGRTTHSYGLYDPQLWVVRPITVGSRMSAHDWENICSRIGKHLPTF